MITWNTQQYLKEDLLIRCRYFTFSFTLIVFLLIVSLQTLMFKEAPLYYNLYCLLYTLSFCYVMNYVVSGIYFSGHVLEDCFYSYSQHIISAVAKISLIPYKLTQRAPETQNL